MKTRLVEREGITLSKSLPHEIELATSFGQIRMLQKIGLGLPWRTDTQDTTPASHEPICIH